MSRAFTRNAVEDRMVGRLDSARTPRSKKIERARPALAALEAAWNEAVEKEGPGAVFRLATKRLRETWAPPVHDPLAAAEAMFVKRQGEVGQ